MVLDTIRFSLLDIYLNVKFALLPYLNIGANFFSQDLNIQIDFFEESLTKKHIEEEVEEINNDICIVRILSTCVLFCFFLFFIFVPSHSLW